MTTSWIPLLVPREDYLELAGLIADRLDARGEPESLAEFAAVTSVVESPADRATDQDVKKATLDSLHLWDLADLRRLATSTFATAQRWARAMDVCSRHVNKFLSTQDVAAESGMTVNEWRDAPRKLPRHLAAHYPNVLHDKWPLAVLSARRLGINDGQVYWAINDEQAQRWLQIREERQQ